MALSRTFDNAIQCHHDYANVEEWDLGWAGMIAGLCVIAMVMAANHLTRVRLSVSAL
jgi:hypothetical protein